MKTRNGRPPMEQGPRLYRDLSHWYPLLTPVEDYAEEAAFYRRLFELHCNHVPGHCWTWALAPVTTLPI
jgi:hypothetical protein